MRPKASWPVAVLSEAHKRYSLTVAHKGLYGVAFFGHSRPSALSHSETTESIWRGICRQCLKEHWQKTR
jgi:hypothetical protein